MRRQEEASDWLYSLPCILFPLSIVLTVYDECTKQFMHISLSIPHNNVLIVSIFYRQGKWYLKTLSSLLKLSQRFNERTEFPGQISLRLEHSLLKITS